MPILKTWSFTACAECPAPISCDIRSACDRAPKEMTADDMFDEINRLCARLKQLQDELANANASLIASREEARQMRIGIDRMEDAHEKLKIMALRITVWNELSLHQAWPCGNGQSMTGKSAPSFCAHP